VKEPGRVNQKGSLYTIYMKEIRAKYIDEYVEWYSVRKLAVLNISIESVKNLKHKISHAIKAATC